MGTVIENMISEERFGEQGFEEEESTEQWLITWEFSIIFIVILFLTRFNIAKTFYLFDVSLLCMPENELFKLKKPTKILSIYNAFLRSERSKEVK